MFPLRKLDRGAYRGNRFNVFQGNADPLSPRGTAMPDRVSMSWEERLEAVSGRAALPAMAFLFYTTDIAPCFPQLWETGGIFAPISGMAAGPHMRPAAPASPVDAWALGIASVLPQNQARGRGGNGSHLP